MTVPAEYVEASADFRRFLIDLRDIASLTTTNQAYTVAQGVLLAFRHRLDVRGVARFASALPPVLRAIFVSKWDPDEPLQSFDDEAAIVKEIQSLRAEHNFATDTSIRDVAVALRKNVDATRFDRALADLPDAAARFWRV